MNITAIDWLEDELNKVLMDNQILQTKHLFKKAKEIELHQIEYAYEDGYNRVAKIIEDVKKQQISK